MGPPDQQASAEPTELLGLHYGQEFNIFSHGGLGLFYEHLP